MQGATDMPLAQDLKFAIRQWKRNPGFSLTVILTLALSIGANTAIFSIVDALLLKALPYPHPERMGTIFTRITGPRPSDERHHVNGEQFELLRDPVPSLISAVTQGGTPRSLKAHAPRHIISMCLTSILFLGEIFLKRKIVPTARKPQFLVTAPGKIFLVRIPTLLDSLFF